MADKAFDKLLLESIDDALSTLGDSARQSIYFHLESKFKVARGQIPSKIVGFSKGLERIFGEGSRFLEILIMKKLHEKTGQSLEWDEGKRFLFADYVSAARRSFNKKK